LPGERERERERERVTFRGGHCAPRPPRPFKDLDECQRR